MSWKLIPQDVLNVCHVFEGRGTIRAEIITKLIPQTIFLCNRDHNITQINSPENFLCNRLEIPRIILCNWG